jgi:hypothetical protein
MCEASTGETHAAPPAVPRLELVSPPAVRVADSAAKVPAEAQEVADPVSAVTDSQALGFRLENRFYWSGLP